MYGDIVKAIGGDKVNVTAIITKTSQDPHSYEATAQDRLVISKAKLVVENGGGYDDFIHTMADDNNIPHDSIVSAVEMSGLAPEEKLQRPSRSQPLPTAATPTTTASSTNTSGTACRPWASSPTQSPRSSANAGSGFGSDVQGQCRLLQVRTDGTHRQAGRHQEPHAESRSPSPNPCRCTCSRRPGWRTTPRRTYTAAIEEGTDVPPAVLKAATDLAALPKTWFLAYNEQTEGPQTEALKNAADAAGVPVVNFSETLPDGKTYLQWMADNVENISKALENKN